MAKPIFCVTHPRACSTAFERVFMTRKDLTTVHEPFGDAFYFGPERLSARYENDEKAREESGFSGSTFKSIFDRLDRDEEEGKRLFIKDIIHYLVPPKGQAARIAPSLMPKKRGIGTEVNGVNGHAETNGINGTNETNGTNGIKGTNETNGRIEKKGPFPFDTEAEPGNPTVVPKAMLERFHFTFLIRNPHSSIPSYYRCCIPPLNAVTGFYEFWPDEAGYDEVRRVFDFLRETGQVGPHRAGKPAEETNGNQVNGHASGVEICVIDADDLLDDPEGIIHGFCNTIGMDYHPDMLVWDNEEDHQKAKNAFEKWRGFHEDAIDSKDLKPRKHKKAEKSREQYDQEWTEKYGAKAAKLIRDTVDLNMDDYLYLKQFAMKA